MYLELPHFQRARRSLAVVAAVGAVVGLVVLASPAPESTGESFARATTGEPEAPVAVTEEAAPVTRFTVGGTLAPQLVPPPRAPNPAPDTTGEDRRLAVLTPTPTDETALDAGEPSPRSEQRVDVEVAPGDTLMGMLLRLGIRRAEAHAAVEGLRDVYDPRRLRPGQRLQIETDAAARRLMGLAFDPSGRERIELVRLEDGGFEARVREHATVVEERLVAAEVRSSLSAAATAAGVPPAVFAEVVRIFSWDVDYQRETRPGDRFAVLYERERVPGGPVVEAGDVRYARLDVGGRTLEAFRFVRDGEEEFFTRDGASLRKFLLRTPIAGGRISSRYGMRRHPILGYDRMHRGVDFAAPTGTAIYAAGSGRLERVGRYGGYGNYIRIRHGNGYATAYAHLSRFADGMRSGTRVRQGDVIGYVGSTGRSTGPHLHFEVLKNGRQVNPFDVARPPAENLEGRTLAAFRSEIRAIETKLADLGGRTFAADRRRDVASGG